jgi:hypothetical protein
VTAFVTIMSLAFLVATGLVYDGGQVLAARRGAIGAAKAAARAGAQGVDVTALRARRVVVPSAPAASAAAATFLQRSGHHGSVAVRGDRVVVTVNVEARLEILTLVGMRTVTVSGTAEARLVRGVTGGET